MTHTLKSVSRSEEGRRKRGKGMIYFIGIEGTPYVKVGRAGDPKRRMAELSTAHPFDLELLYTIPTAGPNSDVRLEKQIHRHLAKQRLKREWFALDPEQLVSAINQFADGHNYVDNPIIHGMIGLRSTIQRDSDGFVYTETEMCFFCHQPHKHGAIAGVTVLPNGLQHYGHRSEHCLTHNIVRKHPSGVELCNEDGYYLWIENPKEEAIRRGRLRKYASWVSEPEYWYSPD